jgi:hypothetical protein
MNQRTRTALSNLVNAARILRDYGFTQHAIGRTDGFSAVQNDDGDWEIDFYLPNELERDATLLTLRLFLQFSEDYSFHRLNRLANDPQLTPEYSASIREIRQSYFEYVNDSPEGVEAGFFEDSVDPSRAEILNVVINGNLAHTHGYQNRQLYLVWTRDPIRTAVLYQVFSRIILVILNHVERLAELTELELENHPEDQGSG